MPELSELRFVRNGGTAGSVCLWVFADASAQFFL